MTIEAAGIMLQSKTFDNKMWVQSSSRPIGTFTCFVSQGDDSANPLSIGGGTIMKLDHTISDTLQQTLYIDFNVKENRTFLGEGCAIWQNCNLDTLLLDIVPKVTSYTSGTNTNFNLYGGYLITPAAGDGTIVVNAQDIKLVEIPYSIDVPTQRQSAGFWDADYSLQTHQLSNIRPNLTGTGQYNIFGTEVNFESIVSIILLGDGQVALGASDVAEFGMGMRIKLTFNTNEPNHAWKCALNLTVSRQHTV
jgi:hypothetical protein